MAGHATLKSKIIVLIEYHDGVRDLVAEFLTRQGARVNLGRLIESPSAHLFLEHEGRPGEPIFDWPFLADLPN
ncbi:MAG: hypothetical protein JO333_02660 [Verrucomicrobia bacterium]|nr:hypothetical protein [Verrucomicrobiota bacterium]